MKQFKNIFTTLALTLAFAACSDDISAPTYTVGEADNTIVVHAGIAEDAQSALASRTLTARRYVAFKQGTAMTARFDGKWVNKGFTNDRVEKSTTGTIKDEDATDIDLDGAVDEALTDTRGVVFAPALHWDDYGTADPNNYEGRTEGITIYAAAIDGETTALNISSWTAQPWPLEANQTSGWSTQDLLTSNNIKNKPSDAGFDGRYRFDDLGDSPSNLLKFTHAMTKVTVVLTAGKGFSGYSTDPASAKFDAAPTVTLKNFYNKGTVNIEDKISTATTTPADIKMHLAEGGAAHTATFDALVFPGNAFENSADILSLTADGNTYTVTAAKLNAAIQTAITNKATTGYPGTDLSLLQGWNYKLLITVDKTAIKVQATIVDWNEVEAQEETPLIRFTDVYGQTGDAFTQDFDFFRSTTIGSGYTDDAYVEHNETAGVHSYTFHDPLYWPDHQTHYFFRGVYPRVQTSASEAGWIPSANVTSSTIAVQNATYAEGTYPSDLAIGYPRPTNNHCTAHNKDVDTEGICATEGYIRMNFEYAMSKVKVRLKSSGTDGKDKVILDNAHVVIEIIGGYNAGRIQLSNGLHDAFVASTDKGNYTLSELTTADTDFDVTTLDAIVPQTISNDVKFRITVTNANGTTDVYEAQVNRIKDSSDQLITEWVHGKSYIYELDIKKTGVNVTATLTDWVEVTADVPVWF